MWLEVKIMDIFVEEVGKWPGRGCQEALPPLSALFLDTRGDSVDVFTQ